MDGSTSAFSMADIASWWYFIVGCLVPLISRWLLSITSVRSICCVLRVDWDKGRDRHRCHWTADKSSSLFTISVAGNRTNKAYYYMWVHLTVTILHHSPTDLSPLWSRDNIIRTLHVKFMLQISSLGLSDTYDEAPAEPSRFRCLLLSLSYHLLCRYTILCYSIKYILCKLPVTKCNNKCVTRWYL